MSYVHRQEVMEVQKNALLYVKLSRYDAAEKLLKSTLAEYGAVANIHNLLGLTYYKQSKFSEAIIEFNRALKANPDFIEAGLNLAATLCDVSLYEDAAIVFNQLHVNSHQKKKLPALISGRIANLHVESGLAYEECGLFSDAIQEYRRALGLFDRMSDVRLRLAKLYLKLGQAEKSYRELEILVKEDDQNAEAHSILGLIFFKMSRTQDAIHHWKEAQRIDPFESTSRGYLSLLGEVGKQSRSQGTT